MIRKVTPKELEEEALAEIARRVRDHAGLSPPGWVLAARLRDRADSLDLPDAAAYLDALDARELHALTEALRVGETRFFRHQAHVASLERLVIPDLVKRRHAGKRVRAWSAGAATGEEPYTLAMLLAEAMPEADGWEVRVSATDISEDALAVARAAVYDEAAVAKVPERMRSRWFVPAGAGRVSVAPPLRHLVRFERQNLVDGVYPHQQDVILCRNVLIYFDRDERTRTVGKLIDALAPGGYLFLGYAESLRGFEGLECLAGEEGPIYRRAFGRAGVAEREKPAAGAEAEKPKRKKTQTAPIEVETTVVVDGQHEDPAALGKRVRAAIAGASARVIVDLDKAEFLGDEVAPVLRRAAAAARAAGLEFELRATRPGPARWLKRHGLEDTE